jgi:glycosyltransferase involved in cell wall biosynthesis/2-polyprenyl-3-methyl-5-hydroxy-6-metoxy-1,4-benzoquinol methylase
VQDLVVVIPAYQPNSTLVELVRAVHPQEWQSVVVIDDGSGVRYQAVFDELAGIPGVQVVPHAINLGKGSALKTGINFALCRYPRTAGIITMDADGQHHPGDVRAIAERFAESPETLILGARTFSGDIPLRSRIGNQITRRIMRAVVGQSLTDTQTGLRAIPRPLLMRMLKVPASGYEFELEMLLAVKHLGVRVVELPIRTIYEPGNPTSHFQPLRDSMRIYFVLLRFAGIGAMTAVLDNLTFGLLFFWTGRILLAQIGARLVGGSFNYATVRSAVFLSEERHAVLLPRYLLVLIANASLSYAGIEVLHYKFGAPVVPAKLVVETLLFLASFAVQRDFVFTRRPSPASVTPTDWDRYYRSVPFTAHVTRKYTQTVLIGALKRFVSSGATMVEIGGANSCFLDGIARELRPQAYHVIDRNEYGLELLRERVGQRTDVMLHRADVLESDRTKVEADVVFSVGVIEHFDIAGTRQAVRAHFDLLKPGGYAMMTFPTPTWLYIAARSIVEALRVWRFTDERALERAEVLEVVREYGDVVFEKTLWPLIFTQRLIVVRKNAGPQPDLQMSSALALLPKHPPAIGVDGHERA